MSLLAALVLLSSSMPIVAQNDEPSATASRTKIKLEILPDPTGADSTEREKATRRRNLDIMCWRPRARPYALALKLQPIYHHWHALHLDSRASNRRECWHI